MSMPSCCPTDVASPLAPESDEEKPADRRSRRPEERRKHAEAAQAGAHRFRRARMQRIVALPIPARNYRDLDAGQRRRDLSAGRGLASRCGTGSQGADTLSKFDLKTRKASSSPRAWQSFDLSANGEKMLLRLGAGGGGPGARQRGAAAVASSRRLGCAAQSRRRHAASCGHGSQRRSAGRVEADVPRSLAHRDAATSTIRTCTALNAADAEKEYETYLDSLGLARRSELHLPGDAGRYHRPATCAAAAATCRAASRSRAACWAPTSKSPTGTIASSGSIPAKAGIRNCARRSASPGINVKEGEYLLAVNGQDLSAADDVSRWLEGHRGEARFAAGRPGRRRAPTRATSP